MAGTLDMRFAGSGICGEERPGPSPMPIWQITATPLAREINLLGPGGAGAGGPFQSDRSARSMTYFFPLRIAANPHRFRR
jgi:hypothetical protein